METATGGSAGAGFGGAAGGGGSPGVGPDAAVPDAAPTDGGVGGAPSDGAVVSPPCPPCADVPRSFPLPGAKHLVVDPQRHVLYVTTSAADPTYANSLVTIDPVSLKVVASTPLGTDPNVLGLSPDASRLWVGIDGAYAIRSVDLSSGKPVPGPQYVLPHPTYGRTNQTVGAMTFLRGSTGSLMLTLFAEREFSGVVVLDEGVPRAAPTYLPTSRLAAGPGDVVYSFNDQNTGFEFSVLTVSATGISTQTYSNLVSGFNNDLVYSASDHRVYAKSGSVVNVADPTMPIRTPGFRIFGPFALLPGLPRAVMLQVPAVSGAVSLALLDTTLFTVRSSATWPSVTEQTTWDLGVVGSDTVAFLASDMFRNLPTRLIVVKTGVLQ